MKFKFNYLTKLISFSFFLSPVISNTPNPLIRKGSGFYNCLNDQVPNLVDSFSLAFTKKISRPHKDLSDYYCDSQGCSEDTARYIKGKEKKRTHITCLFSDNLTINCYSSSTQNSFCVGSLHERFHHSEPLLYLPLDLITYKKSQILESIIGNIDLINSYIANHEPVVAGDNYKGWIVKPLWMGQFQIVSSCIIEGSDREIFCSSHTLHYDQLYFFQFVTNISTISTTKEKIARRRSFSESKLLEFSAPIIADNFDFSGKNDSSIL